MQHRKILITGAAGFIGSAILLNLSDAFELAGVVQFEEQGGHLKSCKL